LTPGWRFLIADYEDGWFDQDMLDKDAKEMLDDKKKFY
jgi:hypothetical protein